MAKTKKIYFQALETLRKEITNGKYSIRTKLPSEAQLVADLNISRTTVKKVLAQLRDEGVIETRKGSGSYICTTSINQLIPVIICKTHPEFRSDELLQGIQDYLDSMGLISLPTFYYPTPKTEVEIINGLIKKGHHNMIVFPLSSTSNVSFYQNLMRKGANLVFLDTLPQNITCDYVSCSNFLGAYMATKKLIDLGHEQIAFCSYNTPKNFNTIAERFNGYLSALKQNSIQIRKENIIFDAHHDDYLRIKKLLNNTKVTAIFASTDQLAFELMHNHNEATQNISIIGFDNSTIAKQISLASISQPHYEIGKTVAELLYKRMLNPKKQYEHIYLPVSLIERDSLFGNKNCINN